MPENGDTFDIDVVIPNHHLAKGLYKIDMNISKFDYTAFARDHDLVFNVLSFEVNHVDADHKVGFNAWPHSLGSICMTDTKVCLSEK